MKTAERRAEVEAAILSAAEELLEEGTPFPRLKIEEVARRGGIGRTGFYFYFRDKRELLMRLAEDVAEALWGQARARAARGDGVRARVDDRARLLPARRAGPRRSGGADRGADRNLAAIGLRAPGRLLTCKCGVQHF